MKKLFTMLVGVLLAGTAFGQEKWVNVIVNGDLEADNIPAYENWTDMTVEKGWNSFWYQYGKNGSAGKGTAVIEDGIGVDGSRGIKIVTRTDAEGQAAGNQDGGFVSWDSQFFVVATEKIPVGAKIKFSMMVKADVAQELETQAHFGPGDYNHYQLLGNVSVTTGWTEFKGEATVDNNHDGNGKGFQSIAFNMAKIAEGNVIYFDNFKLQIVKPVEIDWDSDPGWINFMRKGIYSDDKIKGVSGDGKPWQCTNFTIQVPNEQGVIEQQQAPVVEVEPGVMAVRVPVRGWIAEKVAKLDSLGNPIPTLDEDGNPVIDEEGNEMFDSTSVYKWSDGLLINDGTKKPERYACQFFVSTLHKMIAGERYRFRFKAKADYPTALGTQVHYGPSQYKAYNTFGGESDFPIGTDWKEFELGDAQKKTIPADAAGCQTITFDCITLENQDNYLYFIFEVCSFSEANVTDADRTLGDPEELALPVNSGDDELATTIDAAPLLARFEYTGSLQDFIEGGKAGTSDGIKLSSLKTFDDPEIEPIESFSSLLTWTDGGFINDKGLYIDSSDEGIQLSFDDSSIDGTKININVWNNPDSGIEFGDHKYLKTKLAVSQSGWYYVYNVTLLSEADYNEWIDRLPGDANEDKAVDIEDVVLVINQILGEPVTCKFFNADVTEDGKIDVDDVVAIVNMILSASGEETTVEEAPAAPQLMNILLQNGFKF